MLVEQCLSDSFIGQCSSPLNYSLRGAGMQRQKQKLSWELLWEQAWGLLSLALKSCGSEGVCSLVLAAPNLCFLMSVPWP